ncbi:Predicted arabinose efflux permease, MFS family [Streptosporangium canum]|uniref:Predicted arabinose efflux permease, MFS family n=1 Tax=Streptosporangium canum TaxID=324952 RepID=A0A1I4DVU2_9ACTN|nr:MFS transporter [Streptosporangium canum]SFK96196.1 Predicted arabinose efflux permease, MFS family [Streptosporangium canum]
MTTTVSHSDGGLSRGLLLLMSVATGLAVAGNYFAQPLLDLIGREMGIGPSSAALLVTAAQAGYALGLILLVPLGDLLERRRLAVSLYAVTAVFLLVSATASNGTVLLVSTALTALTSVGAQVVVPFAATLAAPAERGRVVGTVMTGLMLGLLLARTASGALSELGGWRTVYWVAAVLMALMAVLLRIFLPRLGGDGGGRSYLGLLRSTVAMFRYEPLLRWRAGIAALSLASFSVLWTALTLLLAGSPYGWSESAIGLFGLVGAVGALTATVAGRLADRGYVQAVTGAGTVLLVASWTAITAGASTLVWLLVGVIVLDLAHQAVLNSSQNVLYALRPEARNRINSAFMTCLFVGGAVGSALAAVVWVHSGWTGVCVLGATFSAGTVVLWVLERVTVGRTAGKPAKTSVQQGHDATPATSAN